ncbi:mitochondrial outer membrane import complex protein METAXIN-like isoform X1 [Actinidia eriantha]|uniref:mitochondrial outer membrane import complex protein METAXIN-like isoform X1 n=1 Tax=Actinidia eriantha TaxID=165200 RepID=UPI00258B2976|nr:mitochondrial outer membrane import complex protein METAXIN-like isoform X1 [Actinidia eriantha]
MDEQVNQREEVTLVARKACFGLPTACPSCLPVYIYLKFSQTPFNLDFNLTYPDSDQIPYVESGTYVAYNNEKGGVIESLKEDGIVDLDSEVAGVPDWISTKAVVNTWLADALMYELWVGSNGSSAHKIYFSDLPWPIGKFLYFKQTRITKQLLGITKDNADRREEEIYRKATIAYGALSTRLGDQSFFFENRPTSLDAVFLGHALFMLQALPETSVLRSKLAEHSNLVRYADKLKMEFIEAGSSSSIPPSHADPLSSFARGGTSNWSSKPKSKPTKERTEEEKKFRRRAKYFLVTQLVAVLVFLSLLGGSHDAEVELDDDDYDD